MKRGGGVRRRVRFRTATGSVYEIAEDGDGMAWRRLWATADSGRLRSERARLLVWPEVLVGACTDLVSYPIVPGAVRHVVTTEVLEILEVEGDGALWPAPEPEPPGAPR